MSNVRKDILSKESEIRTWISEEESLAEIARRLKCKIDTLYHYLKVLNIEYHGQQSKKGRNAGLFYHPAAEYLGTDKLISSDKLKKKLLRDGIKEYRCECCGQTIWLNEPIPLELHHLDGDHLNNALENLQLLCPNCHAMQDNNSGRNVLKHRQKLARLAELADAPDLDSGSLECGFESHVGHQTKSVDWQARFKLITTCGIDLMKFGWQSKVEQVTELTRRQISDTIEHYKDYFLQHAFIRK